MAPFFNVLRSPIFDSLITIDENIAEKLAAIIGQDLRKVIFNLLHGLVIGGHSGSDESKRMRITIKQVNAALFNALEQILGHVEASWACAHNGKSELFIGAHKSLRLNSLAVLRIVIGWCIEV